jgi:hypothetical protein
MPRNTAAFELARKTDDAIALYQLEDTQIYKQAHQLAKIK